MTSIPDKKHAAVCGLFCPACTAFIGTSEDPERLANMAKRLGRPTEDLQCRGCRSDTRSYFCRTLCTMATCAADRGVDFCGQCSDYPCAALKTFQAAMPHRIELWQSQARIKEVGYETWYAEMTEHYSCPSCGTMNSAYDITCRKCGHEPSCEYVRLHKDAIVKHPTKIK
jgi:predicted RNA-binding Zn-ribbon protein involved in translation (DUF1610 family)